jgi:hypothetical protein
VLRLVVSEYSGFPANRGRLLRNLTTGQTLPANVVQVWWNSNDLYYDIIVAGLPKGVLPDGNWRLTINADEMKDEEGTPIDGDGDGTSGGNYVYDFFHLSGDANHDRKVDFNDLAILAQNYNTAGKTFAQGNFDYDPSGTVDFNDLALLAQRYNTSLPPVPAATVAVAAQLPEDSTGQRNTAKPLFNASVPVQRKKPAKPLARRA